MAQDKYFGHDDDYREQIARKQWSQIDLNGDGSASQYEMKKTLKFTLFETTTLPDGWVRRVDRNGKEYYEDTINRTTQWERPKGTKKSSFSKDTIRMLIEKFDDNHNGTLQKREFIEMSKWLQKRSDEFKTFDNNHNHEMDAKEFHRYIKNAFERDFDWKLERDFLERRNTQELVNVFTKHSREGHKNALNFEEFIKLRLFFFNASKIWSEKSEHEYHERRPVHNVVNFTYNEFLESAVEKLM